MIKAQALPPQGQNLSHDQVRIILQKGLTGTFSGQKVLVLIPDHTRSLPLPMLFSALVEVLADVKQLDFMVALGTHPPLDKNQMIYLVGITHEERADRYKHIGLINHEWNSPGALTQIGVISGDQVRELAGTHWHPSLAGDVPVQINRRVFNYDHLLILGPTFPHEVVGFSGGVKYLFPGISGSEMINATHWLGALVGVPGTIGIKDTPIRAMIQTAADHVPIPITLISLVVAGEDLVGIFIGEHQAAWEAAADLSAHAHIRWCDRPYNRVLSKAPGMYDELWTAAKAMYKLEPVLAPGAELIIYAPHLETVSHVHGKHIFEIGYHTLPYFLEQWEKFKHIPLGVLAHSTHVRGAGAYTDGVETPHFTVTLASRIPPGDCRRLNLGYLDPDSIDIEGWKDREDEGILYVPKAGETLYRLNT
jgi:nickel-dependent lactate racemase